MQVFTVFLLCWLVFPLSWLLHQPHRQPCWKGYLLTDAVSWRAVFLCVCKISSQVSVPMKKAPKAIVTKKKNLQTLAEAQLTSRIPTSNTESLTRSEPAIILAVVLGRPKNDSSPNVSPTWSSPSLIAPSCKLKKRIAASTNLDRL